MAALPGCSSAEPPPAPARTLWFAGMETGDLSEWEMSSIQRAPCGGQFNNPGGASSVASREQSKSGAWSARLSSPSTGATRLHRWCETRPEHPRLLYSAWYYLPTTYQINGWANWIQFKSKRADGGGSDPFFFLDVRNRGSSTGPMYFMLTWWNGLQIEGPRQGEYGYRTWISPLNLPVRRWFKIDVLYVSAADFTGSIRVWQDRHEIFSVVDAVTRYAGGATQFGINSYGERIVPEPVKIYVDDITISEVGDQ